MTVAVTWSIYVTARGTELTAVAIMDQNTYNGGQDWQDTAWNGFDKEEY